MVDRIQDKGYIILHGNMNIIEGLTFDDVLLVPKFSNVKSRQDVDTSVSLGKGINLKIPIISANMKHVTGPEMARVIAELGGLALLHRFDSIEQQIQNYFDSTDSGRYTDYVGVSIGVTDYHSSRTLIKRTGTRIVCIDIAHGHSQTCLETARLVSSEFPDVLLIAGNIVTKEASESLLCSGVDLVKVGVGPGSLCTTRVETGNGVPQLTAISDVRKSVEDFKWDQLIRGRATNPNIQLSDVKAGKIIADGGIKNSGDIVKALCFADTVMLGSLLAGTSQAPGELITIDGKSYKTYAGSSTFKSKHVEGVERLVPFKGDVRDVIEKLMQGLKSGMSYQGVNNLTKLRASPRFVRISNAGLIESNPHTHSIVK